MGSTARSAPLELLDAFGRESLGTESGEPSIPRRNLALEKDATRPYTVRRALHREIFAISTKRSRSFAEQSSVFERKGRHESKQFTPLMIMSAAFSRANGSRQGQSTRV